MAQAPSRSGILRAFASPKFRVFWTGYACQILGIWVNRVALGWLTWQLTGSTAWLGYVAAASMLPTVFLGAFSGASADRYGHQRQMICAGLGNGFFASWVAALTLLDMISIEAVFVLALLGGVSRAFSMPARVAMIPLLVPREDISAATGVTGSTIHVGSFVGPAIGGLIVAGWGISAGLVVNALCFFINTALVATLSLPRVERKPGDRRSLLDDVKTGIRYALGNEALRSVMMLTAVVAVFLQPFIEMLPSFADEVFHRGASGLAMLNTAAGIGAMAAGLWIAHRGRTEGLVRVIFAMLMSGIGGLVLFSATEIFALGLAALAFAGSTLVTANVCCVALIQNGVAPELRGRVISLSGIVTISGPALGAVVIGWVGQHTGVQAPVMASALLALLAVLLMGRRTMRRAARLEAAGA